MASRSNPAAQAKTGHGLYQLVTLIYQSLLYLMPPSVVRKFFRMTGRLVQTARTTSRLLFWRSFGTSPTNRCESPLCQTSSLMEDEKSITSFASACTFAGRSLSTLSPPRDFSPLASLVPTPEQHYSPGLERVSNVRDPEMDLIFERNRAWAAEQKAKDPEFFARLSSGQRPKYMFVGCADSRIPAENIMGMQPGDLFVHRNVANLAVNGDLNFLSVLHFAVEHLQVGHIIVCGHYGCAGVYHAMHPTDTGGILENWLRNIRDVQRLHHAELEAITDENARFKRVVELNVIEQCVNIFKFGILQRKRKASMASVGKNVPQIHALVYDISTGLLHELPLRAYFKHYSTMYKSIYELI